MDDHRDSYPMRPDVRARRPPGAISLIANSCPYSYSLTLSRSPIYPYLHSDLLPRGARQTTWRVRPRSPHHLSSMLTNDRCAMCGLTSWTTISTCCTSVRLQLALLRSSQTSHGFNSIRGGQGKHMKDNQSEIEPNRCVQERMRIFGTTSAHVMEYPGKRTESRLCDYNLTFYDSFVCSHPIQQEKNKETRGYRKMERSRDNFVPPIASGALTDELLVLAGAEMSTSNDHFCTMTGDPPRDASRPIVTELPNRLYTHFQPPQLYRFVSQRRTARRQRSEMLHGAER
jgi:hypothetical protein